jgi:micrococcal nuclease
MGTRIHNVRLTKVTDGDTIRVEINGDEYKLRLLCLDTEESNPGGSKPVTNAGKEATKLAKTYFGCNNEGTPAHGDVFVDIEFDTTDPEDVCLQKHFDIYERLLCYVYKGSENYNLKAVRDGWSPYFIKYGRSRLHHEEFLVAEATAQKELNMIWNPGMNVPGKSRDYKSLIPWWYLRDSVVVDYRNKGLAAGVLCVRPDYTDIVTAATNESTITVLCDLQKGTHTKGGGALAQAGSDTHPFDLWIPDRHSATSQAIVHFIDSRYANEGGRGYVYVSGNAFIYSGNGHPEIKLTSLDQLSDIPPGP